MHVSERRACAALGQHRSTQRKAPRGREDEERLTANTAATAIARSPGCSSRRAGSSTTSGSSGSGDARGSRSPINNPSAAGSGLRTDPASDCVPSTAITSGPTTLIDEFTHECLAIRVARKLKAIDVIDVLSDLFILRGVPGHIRSDNGPEFVAKAVQEWITAVGAKTAYITPGSPWENGYVESFNARLRDELLDGEIFYTLREAQIVIESWRRHFNTVRPHESLGYKPPAPEVFVPAFAAWPAAPRRPASPATLVQRPLLN
jgi:putative transposase